MKNYAIKFVILAAFVAFIVTFGLSRQSVHANQGGPPASRTGGPSELTCAISGCHTGSALNSGGGTLAISGLPTNYTPGQNYDVTVTLTQANRVRFGFQLTALTDAGAAGGTITVTETSRTQLISGVVGANLRRYIMHTPTGTAANGAGRTTWTFRWTAPANATTGKVTFYVAGNGANNNGDESGDFIYTTNLAVAAPAAVAAVTAVSAASFSPTALASDAIASLFGTNLAADIVIANTTPLPTELAGVKVTIKDSANTSKDAPLLFIAPTQINYIMPTGLANGAATITVTRNGTAVGQGSTTIETVTPGLFSANASGQGIAAGYALRLRNGAVTTESIAQINQAGTAFEPVALDLGPEGDTVGLVLFGTGLRKRSAASAVTATIGGTNAEVLFAGDQGSLAGLDQVNLIVPRSLAGRGAANIIVTVDGKATNTLSVTIK